MHFRQRYRSTHLVLRAFLSFDLDGKANLVASLSSEVTRGQASQNAHALLAPACSSSMFAVQLRLPSDPRPWFGVLRRLVAHLPSSQRNPAKPLPGPDPPVREGEIDRNRSRALRNDPNEALIRLEHPMERFPPSVNESEQMETFQRQLDDLKVVVDYLTIGPAAEGGGRRDAGGWGEGSVIDDP